MSTPEPWKLMRELTEEVPLGAEQRVLERLYSPPRARARWIPALLGAAAVAVVAVLWLAPPRPAGLTVGETGEVQHLAWGSRWEFETARSVFLGERALGITTRPHTALEFTGPEAVHLRHGTAAFSLQPGQGRRPFVVHAGEVTVEVTGTVFVVEHLEQVRVWVQRGSVKVHSRGQRYPVSAGQHWPSLPVVAMSPTELALSRQADLTLSQQKPVASAVLTAALADAEQEERSAQEMGWYEQGLAMLRQQQQPNRALQLFREGLSRFPTGALHAEMSLSAVESAVAMKSPSDIIEESQRFLSRHRNNERAAEVQLLLGKAQLEANRPREAALTLLELGLHPRHAEEALYWSCVAQSRYSPGEARATARKLAERFPHGAFTRLAEKIF